MAADVAAALLGVVFGLLASPGAIYFIRRLQRGERWSTVPVGYSITLLVGSEFAFSPVGARVFSDELWTTYTIALSVTFLALGAISFWRYAYNEQRE